MPSQLFRHQTPAARRARILEAIRGIPAGFVRTYGDIDPKAPRHVGHVLASTHDDELPWHRVVRSDGTVAKGTRQLNRLRREGVPIHNDRVVLKEARLPR